MTDTSVPVKKLMTKEVIAAAPDDTIHTVKAKLLNNIIHHVPVVEQDRVVGMISQSDINKIEHHFTLFGNPEAEISNNQLFNTILAKEIMAQPVISLNEDDPVSQAVELFLTNQFHALPIVDHQDKLVGILTTFDLIKYAFVKRSI